MSASDPNGSPPRPPPRPPPRLEALVERLLGGGPGTRFVLGDLREEFAGRPSVALYALRGVTIAARLRGRRLNARIARGGGRMGGSVRDLAHGLRGVRRRPALSGVVIVTLALGIAATTTVVSAVRGVLLAPLPYADPDRLVRLEVNTGGAGWYGASEPEYLDLERDLASLEGIAGYVAAERTLGDTDGPRRAPVVFATADLIPLLDVAPVLGRAFTAEEDQPGAAPVAVLGHGLWRGGFAGDPDVVGRTLTLSGTEHTIVGVMPEGFSYPEPGVEAWVPLRMDRSDPDSRANHYLSMVGRLRTGADLSTAAAELERFAAATRERFPENYATRGFRARIVELHDWIVGPTRVPLLVLLVTSAIVLLVACANVANLLLVRAEARAGEMTLRTALGASRGRLVRQLLAESAVLAGAGGLAGCALAALGVRALVRMAPPGTPRIENVALDPVMLLWAAVVTVGTGVLFGLLPAVRAGRHGSGAATLGGRGAAAGRGRGGARTRRVLLAVQVALAAVLSVGAGLMLRTVSNLYGTDLGMRPEGVLALDVTPAAGAYPAAAERVQLYEALVRRLEAVPGIGRAAATCTLPTAEFCGYLSLILEGGEGTAIGDAHDGVREIVTPGYFETLGLRVLSGRVLTPEDHAEAPLVAVVNETMARDLWPGEDPLGQRFRMWSEGWPFMEVVGVVADVRHRGPDQPAEPAFWVPHAQAGVSAYETPLAMSLVLRSAAGDPAALAPAARAVVRELVPSAAIARVRTMDGIVGATLALRRFTLRLLQGFSVVALFLAAIGIYGVMAMVVSERRAEIGVRKALGAAPGRLLGSVLREGLSVTLLGAAAGLAGGVVLARWMRTLLYEVSAVDPLTLAGVLSLLLALAATASLLPAWRAARVDPMVTLRGDA